VLRTRFTDHATNTVARHTDIISQQFVDGCVALGLRTVMLQLEIIAFGHLLPVHRFNEGDGINKRHLRECRRQRRERLGPADHRQVKRPANIFRQPFHMVQMESPPQRPF